MYMGQLMTGEVALQCFQKGIQLMTQLLEQDVSYTVILVHVHKTFNIHYNEICKLYKHFLFRQM